MDMTVESLSVKYSVALSAARALPALTRLTSDKFGKILSKFFSHFSNLLQAPVLLLLKMGLCAAH